MPIISLWLMRLGADNILEAGLRCRPAHALKIGLDNQWELNAKRRSRELYNPMDPELVAARRRARDLCQELNATREEQQVDRRRILRDLFGSGGDTVWVQPPFYCDYGFNIHLGTRVFFNFNCVVLDVCEVQIGDCALFGRACKS